MSDVTIKADVVYVGHAKTEPKKDAEALNSFLRANAVVLRMVYELIPNHADKERLIKAIADAQLLCIDLGKMNWPQHDDGNFIIADSVGMS